MKKSQFIKSFEAIYENCRIWISELNFWEDEHTFMKDLTTKYCYLVPSKDQALQLREIFNELNGTLDDDIQRIKKRISLFQVQMTDLVKNDNSIKIPDFEKEFKLLQCDLNLLRVKYQNIKKDLFDLMKSILKEVNIAKLQDFAA